MEYNERILVVYPTTKGFTFLVLESPEMIVDFGNVETVTTEKTLEKFTKLVDEYWVNRVITERFEKTSARKAKAKNLALECKAVARKKKIKTSSYSKTQVDESFASFGAFTKYARAQAVVEVIPQLHHVLPNKRKIYQAEHTAMFVLDCAVLALTHFWLQRD